MASPCPLEPSDAPTLPPAPKAKRWMRRKGAGTPRLGDEWHTYLVKLTNLALPYERRIELFDPRKHASTSAWMVIHQRMMHGWAEPKSTRVHAPLGRAFAWGPSPDALVQLWDLTPEPWGALFPEFRAALLLHGQYGYALRPRLVTGRGRYALPAKPYVRSSLDAALRGGWDAKTVEWELVSPLGLQKPSWDTLRPEDETRLSAEYRASVLPRAPDNPNGNDWATRAVPRDAGAAFPIHHWIWHRLRASASVDPQDRRWDGITRCSRARLWINPEMTGPLTVARTSDAWVDEVLERPLLPTRMAGVLLPDDPAAIGTPMEPLPMQLD